MSVEEHFRKLLRAKGLRSSASRLQILELLEEGPKKYRDFLDRLHMDRVSLYRNLRDLEAGGLLHKVVSPEGEVIYFLCETTHDAHIHLVCRRCRKTLDFKAESIPVIQGFRPTGGVIWGDCAEHS